MSTPIDGITGVVGTPGITGITNPIQKIAPPVRSGQEEQPAALDGVKDSPFGSIFSDMIQNVKDTEADVAETEYLLSTGQLDNPVQVGIAGYKAEISLSLLIQLRDRALTAYNELKNMSV